MSYKGLPAWIVGYKRLHIAKKLEDFFINGERAIEQAAAYALTFASSVEEAREKVKARVYMRQTDPQDRTLDVECWNTKIWHGEPLDALTAKREYEAQEKAKFQEIRFAA